MTTSALPPSIQRAGQLSWVVHLLGIASGCAIMLNVLAWFQILQLSSGSTAGTRVLLPAIVLAGLCVGGVAGAGRSIRGSVFGFLNLALGVIGFLLAVGLRSGSGSAVIATVLLLPGAILMGMTLPAMVRLAGSRETTSPGALFCGYLAGAFAGSMVAGFWLLPRYDVAVSAYAGAGVNLVIGLWALTFVRRPEISAAGADAEAAVAGSRRVTHLADALIYVAIGLSGLTALGAMSIWTRLLAMVLGPTAYSYTIIVAVAFAGLAVGAAAGTMLARNAKSPRTGLAWCQALSCVGMGWAAWAITNGVTNWPIDPIYILEGRTSFGLDFARAAWGMVPATICWGASFPLALAAISGETSGRDAGKVVGRVFAALALGGLLGTLFVGLFAVRTWGTEGSGYILIGVAGLGAMIAAFSLLADSVFAGKPEMGTFINATSALLAAICIAAVTIGILVRGGSDRVAYDRVPWQLVAYGREIVPLRREFLNRSLQDLREGQAASIAVVSDRVTDRFLHVNGLQLSSNSTEDLQLQYMLGHYPALFHPAPRKVLVLGCGTGIVAGSFAMDLPPREAKSPGDVKIVICESEPLLPQMVANVFREENYGVLLSNPTTGKFVDDRVEMVTDDPRHYLETTDETFDLIAGSLTPPWVQGAGNLQTTEYFALAKKHLRPGGLVTQWVPLYSTSADAVKSQMKTFFEAFPAATAWWNDRGMNDGIRQYDIVLIGGNEPLKIDAEDLRKRMGPLLKRAFARVQLDSPVAVLRSYAGAASDLGPWVAGAVVNRDANLRLQYVAGRTLNVVHAADFLDTILSARTFPAGFVNLTDEQREELVHSWESASPHVVREELLVPESKPQ